MHTETACSFSHAQKLHASSNPEIHKSESKARENQNRKTNSNSKWEPRANTNRETTIRKMLNRKHPNSTNSKVKPENSILGECEQGKN